jgi:hypothetical protein
MDWKPGDKCIKSNQVIIEEFYCSIKLSNRGQISSIDWSREFTMFMREKVYTTPSPMDCGLNNPQTYETVYITFLTFQN